MQLSKNTSKGSIMNILVKVVLFLFIGFGLIVMLGKIEFPIPNKQIEKIIPNEKLKVVK